MSANPDEPEDSISGAAERYRERRDEQRAKVEAMRKAREAEGDLSSDESNPRKLLAGLAIIVLIAAAGWFLLRQMRCDDRYSSISGYLFHECH